MGHWDQGRNSWQHQHIEIHTSSSGRERGRGRLVAAIGGLTASLGLVTALFGKPIVTLIKDEYHHLHDNKATSTASMVDPCFLPDNTALGGQFPSNADTFGDRDITKSTDRAVIRGDLGSVAVEAGVRVGELDICGNDIRVVIRGQVAILNATISPGKTAGIIVNAPGHVGDVYTHGRGPLQVVAYAGGVIDQQHHLR